MMPFGIKNFGFDAQYSTDRIAELFQAFYFAKSGNHLSFISSIKKNKIMYSLKYK